MTTKTIEVTLPQEQYERLTRVAKERDQSPAELLGNLAVEFLETAKDEAANYRAIAEAQSLHPGEYVAVRQGRIVTHDKQVTTLLQTLKEKFNLTSTEVLLVKAEAADLRIRHPQLTSA